MVNIQGKSLLGLQGVPREEIELILRVAKKMKAVVKSDNKKLSLLKGGWAMFRRRAAAVIWPSSAMAKKYVS